MATIAVPTPVPSPAADAESLRNAVQGNIKSRPSFNSSLHASFLCCSRLVELLVPGSGHFLGTYPSIHTPLVSTAKCSRFSSISASRLGHGREGPGGGPRPENRRAARRGTPRLRQPLQGVPPQPPPLRALRPLPESDDHVDDGPGGEGREAGERGPGEARRRPGRVGAVEASCASSPDHLIAVRRAYRSLFGCSLEEDVAARSAFQEPLRKLLVSLVRSYRCEEERVDVGVARHEAAQLAEAIRKKEPHDGEVVRIVSTRSKPQLRATFQCYKEEHGADIEEDIKNYSSNQFARMLKIAVWCLTSPEKHFAEVIRYSILGLGTDEDAVTRAIVSRAEIDMKKIKEEYKIRFKTTVTSDVIGDTSGYYKDILLALVGSEA